MLRNPPEAFYVLEVLIDVRAYIDHQRGDYDAFMKEIGRVRAPLNGSYCLPQAEI